MYNNEYNRYVLEVLEHKVVPFVKEVRDCAIDIKGLLMIQQDADKILSAINKLEKEVTKLMLRESKKKRNNDGKENKGGGCLMPGIVIWGLIVAFVALILVAFYRAGRWS